MKLNQILIAFWVFLAGIVLQVFLVKYGAYNLFLYPEYLDKVNFLSHLIFGFSLGGFIMAYQVSTYILIGRRFPFLASLKKPFARYVLNNFIIPLAYLIIYFIQLMYHQRIEQLETWSTIFINIIGVLIGIGSFFFISMAYFLHTNLTAGHVDGGKRRRYRPIQTLLSKREKWYIPIPGNSWEVDTYISYPLKIKHTRDTTHYDKRTLQLIFMQNHVNASVFDLIVIGSIIFFSLAKNSPVFIIPAAANFLLMFTMILLFTSAIYSWFRKWSIFVIVFILMGYNWITTSAAYNFENFAYGMSYENPVAYSNETVRILASDTLAEQNDTRAELEVLNRWVSVQPTRGKKPKLVLINVSGGGSRAAMWSFYTMQKLDSALQGNLMTHTHLITGASGGMIGASLYRELYARSMIDPKTNPNAPSHVTDISNDLLNAVFLNFTLSDWLLRLRKIEYAGYKYPSDRGYAFEQQLNKNTHGVLDKKLIDYRGPEQNCLVPTMIFAPTIANDGRRLLISARPLSYLTCQKNTDGSGREALNDAVSFNQLFRNVDHDSLSYLSVLRMNATFFYILPNVSLPTEPRMEVIDAGFRDNLGMVTTIAYLNHFSDWIQENTSGVVMVRIVDHTFETDVQNQPDRSFIESLKGPVAGVYNNFLNIQDFNNDLELIKLNQILGGKLQIIDFQMDQSDQKEISLSWHLTGNEKKRIREALYKPHNRRSMILLKKSLYLN